MFRLILAILLVPRLSYGYTGYFNSVPYRVLDGRTIYARDLNNPMAAVSTGIANLVSGLQTGQGVYTAMDTGVANAYVMSLTATPVALADGLEVWLKPAATNSGASTLNLNSFGVKSIRNPDGSVLQGGELIIGYYSHLKYNGTYWQLTTNTAREMVSSTLHENSVGSIADLAALEDSPAAIFVEGRVAPGDGGQGFFGFSLGDYSAACAADPLHGIYIPRDSDPTCLSGVYSRSITVPANAAWWGATGNGTTDDTSALQAALTFAEGKSLFIQKPSVSYKHGALTFPSNIFVDIEPGAIFEAIPGIVDGIRLWNIIDESNVAINAHGVTLQGLKIEYTTGEQRHGVYITGSTNITVYGLASNDTGGDGFYIGAGTQGFSENVSLVDVSGDNNRRQGLSLTSGKNIKIIRPTFTNTTGTNPQSGIDIEPNANDEFLENIIIEDPVVEDNAGYGLVVYLGAMDSTSAPVNVDIVRAKAKNNPLGVSNSGIGVDGSIRFIDPIARETSSSGFTFRQCRSDSVRIELIRPKAIDTNQSESSSATLGSAILVYSPSGDTGAELLGNVHIYNPSINGEKYAAKNTRALSLTDQRGLGGSISGISFIDPVVVQQTAATPIYSSTVADLTIRDSFNKLSWSLTNADYTLSVDTLIDTVSTELFTATRSITLGSDLPIGHEITFEVGSEQELRILPGTGVSILPITPVAGKFIYSSYSGGVTMLGASITLKKVSATSWRVLRSVGLWLTEA